MAAQLRQNAGAFFVSVLIVWISTMTTYAFFRMLAALCGTLDLASRFTGVAIQILIVYTGYLIPPRQMHPWFSWLRWINPLQYSFECLISNEFHGLELHCVPPNLVPQGPGVQSAYQSCTLAGSKPGQVIVDGANYIKVAYGYSYSHLWRNFGILCGFFAFFFAMTIFGMERMKPNSGGRSITVFKRGQIPKRVEEDIEIGGRRTNDEESGEKAFESPGTSSSEKPELNYGKSGSGIAKNETIFTWRNVNYDIPYQGGQ